MPTIIDCESTGHSLIELYSFATDRGRKLRIVQQCEICGGVEIIELCRGKGRRRVIVVMKETEFYKRWKKEKMEKAG